MQLIPNHYSAWNRGLCTWLNCVYEICIILHHSIFYMKQNSGNHGNHTQHTSRNRNYSYQSNQSMITPLKLGLEIFRYFDTRKYQKNVINCININMIWCLYYHIRIVPSEQARSCGTVWLVVSLHLKNNIFFKCLLSPSRYSETQTLWI